MKFLKFTWFVWADPARHNFAGLEEGQWRDHSRCCDLCKSKIHGGHWWWRWCSAARKQWVEKVFPQGPRGGPTSYLHEKAQWGGSTLQCKVGFASFLSWLSCIMSNENQSSPLKALLVQCHWKLMNEVVLWVWICRQAILAIHFYGWITLEYGLIALQLHLQKKIEKLKLPRKKISLDCITLSYIIKTLVDTNFVHTRIDHTFIRCELLR